MGLSMGTSPNDLQSEADTNGKELVDNEKASRQGLSSAKPRGMNWTEILNRYGLEAPGYQETVKEMIRIRNQSSPKAKE